MALAPKTRKNIFRLVFFALVLLAVVFLIGLLELAASYYVRKESGNRVDHPRLHHTWLPKATCTHYDWIAQNPEYPNPYVHTYNSQGWIADHDILEKKPAGCYRIFYVGDSFTEGCVPMDQSVPSRVQAFLNARRAACGHFFEVINTGTTSYSPVIYYVLIRYYLLRYAPDLIVINVDMSDNYDDWRYSQNLLTDAHGNPWAVSPTRVYDRPFIQMKNGVVKNTLWVRLHIFLYEHSYLYNFIQQRLASFWPKEAGPIGDDPKLMESLHRSGIYTPWAWCQGDRDTFTESNVRRTMDVLARIIALCQENKVKVLLTGVPHYEQYAKGRENLPLWSARPHEELKNLALKSGAAYLDSYAAMAPFVAGTRQSDLYYKHDMHFNPRGNALWSQCHIQALMDPKNQLLPQECYGNGSQGT